MKHPNVLFLCSMLRDISLTLALVLPFSARAEQITVFAAASLKNALDEVTSAYTEQSEDAVVISYAASSILARQIQFGAPADVFISANTAWMDALVKSGDISPQTHAILLSNRLVLIAAETDAADVRLDADLDVSALLMGGRLAVALVDAVPAGIYAKASLQHLGLWDATTPYLAQTDNVRGALALVASGETPYGIVYASDAEAEPNVKVVAYFPATSHPPIRYSMAATMRAIPEALPFLDHLRMATSQDTFQRHGFLPAPGSQ